MVVSESEVSPLRGRRESTDGGTRSGTHPFLSPPSPS